MEAGWGETLARGGGRRSGGKHLCENQKKGGEGYWKSFYCVFMREKGGGGTGHSENLKGGKWLVLEQGAREIIRITIQKGKVDVPFVQKGGRNVVDAAAHYFARGGGGGGGGGRESNCEIGIIIRKGKLERGSYAQTKGEGS